MKPRRHPSFTQQELIRAVRAFEAAGREVLRAEIEPGGKIILIFANSEVPEDAIVRTPLDEWRAGRDAH